jgi:hypothetical protein
MRQHYGGDRKIFVAFEVLTAVVMKSSILWDIHRGADTTLAFRICSTTKRIFLGWVKEVTTTKS